MRQKIVGNYPLGPLNVQLVLREGTGGEFWTNPDEAGVPLIKVGADHEGGWTRVVEITLHEALELVMTLRGHRLIREPDYAHDSAGFLFVMDHSQFSEVTAQTGMFLGAALPDLNRAYKKWRKS